MILRSSSLIGLALADRSVTCAQLSVAGARITVERRAVLALPSGVSLEQPDALGKTLGAFLREQGFSASRAVIGVPAKWLIAVDREVPPAGEDEVLAVLRLQAERMSATESGELVFDAVNLRDARAGGKVMLVGILRRQLDRIAQTMDAAGLNVVSVTPTALALAGAASDASDASASTTLLLGRQGAELVWRDRGTPRMLRHISLSSANGSGEVHATALGTELRRAVALVPMPSSNSVTGGAGNDGGNDLKLWDLLGLSTQQIGELSERLGRNVRPLAPATLLGASANGAATDRDAGQYMPAIALALAGAKRQLPLDLANSKLAPVPEQRLSRGAIWAIVISAIVVLAVGSLYWDVHQRQTELDEIKAQLSTLAPDIKSADSTIGHLSYGRGFLDTRPPMLECLREVTLAFRDDEPLWVTSFALRDNRTGTLTGKSTDQRFVLGLLDRLKKNPKFSDVKLLDMRDAGGRTKEIAFSLSFTFIAVE